MHVLGVKIAGHDTGAALIADGKVIAIAEERLNRVKHSHNMFPQLAIQYCLDALNVKSEEVNLVVIDQIDTKEAAPMERRFRENTGGAFRNAKVAVINHHDAHAASAFFCSPFDEAAILVYDGAGEQFRQADGTLETETETLYRGSGNRLTELQKTKHIREGKIFPYTFGIGKLYSFISERYIGLGKYNEGKMMGLAPYGNGSVLARIPPERWFTEVEGHIVCNAQIRYPKLPLFLRIRGKSLPKLAEVTRNVFRSTFKRLTKRVTEFSKPQEASVFTPIDLPKPPRTNERLPDDYYASVAYAAQKVLEEVAVSWGQKLKSVTGLENLCIAGGVGLNIDANKNFIDRAGFRHIFIQPGCSDTGIPLGCALYGWHMILGRPRFWNMEHAALGRTYSEAEIRAALRKFEDRIEYKKSAYVAKDAAALVADRKIIGWFQGGAEYGPRALGNRSIICDTRPADMKDILNLRVKHRESWRPFAAVVLREKMSEWFELNEESPFMLLAAPVKKEKRETVPSIVHIDGTCRIQSVTRAVNGRYYELVEEFEKLTGVPMLLNTSYNLAGDPIIETPKDALECFLKTEMDYLIIEDYIIQKRAA